MKSYGNITAEADVRCSPRPVLAAVIGATEKALWATDAYFMDAPQQLGRVVFAQIAENDKRRILAENTARVVHIGDGRPT